MYQLTISPRYAPSMRDAPRGAGVQDLMRFALGRVEKALTGFAAGMQLDPARLVSLLEKSDSAPSAEVLFARGWLGWLAGNLDEAEKRLNEAAARAKEDKDLDQLGRAAY